MAGGPADHPFQIDIRARQFWGPITHCPNSGPQYIPSIRQLPQLHSWIENKFMLRLLLCILGLFLPSIFTLSFHYPSSEGASVRIRSEDIMEKFSQLLGRNETHTLTTLFIHVGLLSQLQKRNCEQISKCREYHPDLNQLSLHEHPTTLPLNNSCLLFRKTDTCICFV